MSARGAPASVAAAQRRRTILVAGMGNLLRGDDAFGIEVVRRLCARTDLPPEVRAMEFGIAGISLVQELLDGYGMLIVVDAASVGRPPGSVVTLAPELPEVDDAAWDEVLALIGDPHTTTPSRVLLLARALGSMPQRTFIIGCEPLVTREAFVGLSAPVDAAIDKAVHRVMTLARVWLSDEDIDAATDPP